MGTKHVLLGKGRGIALRKVRKVKKKWIQVPSKPRSDRASLGGVPRGIISGLDSGRAAHEQFAFNPTTHRLAGIDMVTRKLAVKLCAHLLQPDGSQAVHVYILILSLVFSNFLSSLTFALIPSSIFLLSWCVCFCKLPEILCGLKGGWT